jgi:hypothetical protein
MKITSVIAALVVIIVPGILYLKITDRRGNKR